MYLYLLGGGGPQRPPQHFFEHVRQQADHDEQNDAEPRRSAGQHLHKDVVHPLVVQERPVAVRRHEQKNRLEFTTIIRYRQASSQGNRFIFFILVLKELNFFCLVIINYINRVNLNIVK